MLGFAVIYVLVGLTFCLLSQRFDLPVWILTILLWPVIIAILVGFLPFIGSDIDYDG